MSNKIKIVRNTSGTITQISTPDAVHDVDTFNASFALADVMNYLEGKHPEIFYSVMEFGRGEDIIYMNEQELIQEECIYLGVDPENPEYALVHIKGNYNNCSIHYSQLRKK